MYFAWPTSTSRGKRVLIREDLNVPVQNGVVTSDARIRASLPTIKLAHEGGARVHGDVAPRPARGGRVRRPSSRSRRSPRGCPSCSAARCASSATGSTACSASRARSCCSRTCASTRARRRTTTSSRRSMAALCDVYVMDAFGTAHRAEASTHGVGRVRAGGLRRPAARRTSSTRSKRRSATRSARWSRSSAARRSRPSSPCSRACSARSTS